MEIKNGKTILKTHREMLSYSFGISEQHCKRREKKNLIEYLKKISSVELH